MAVTVLHAADLHLGSPLRAVEAADASLAERLHRATHEALDRVVSVALSRGVDLVVVAGDLYDRAARSVRANRALVGAFERLDDAGVPCFVAHGNHDPLGGGAEKLPFPPNVRVFGADGVECAAHPAEGDPEAYVLGRSYGSRWEGDALVEEYAPPDRTVPAVGVLHTGLDPEGRRYAPCAPADLADRPVDYWALGHVHRPREIDGAPAAYAGIPQGRHVGEAAVGGCLLVDVAVDEPPDPTFVPTSPVVWRDRTVDVGDGGADGDAPHNLADVESRVEDRTLDLRTTDPERLLADLDLPVETRGWEPAGFVCRWTLAGRGAVHDALDDEATGVLAERLRDRATDDSPFVWTESVRDRTAPPLPDRETLAERDEAVAELLALADELRADPEFRDRLRSAVGDVWQPVDDPDRERVPPDRLALDDARLDDLFDRALDRSVEELATRRDDAY